MYLYILEGELANPEDVGSTCIQPNLDIAKAIIESKAISSTSYLAIKDSDTNKLTERVNGKWIDGITLL